LDPTKSSIYNLDKTIVLLKRALNFLVQLKKQKGLLLVISTSLKSQRLVKYIGESTSSPYIQRRWIKGLLTNWENISSSIKFLNIFFKKLHLTKKRESKLVQTYGGLRNLSRLPDAVLFLDLDSNKEALNEAKRLNIPVIAIVDNHYKHIELIDYPILSNTGTTLPLFLIVSLIIETLKK
jgi:small subunit ribosomal protein S2